MQRRTVLTMAAAASAGWASGCATRPAPAPDMAALEAEVRATETAFAKTMADRDHAAFAALLADEAIFMNGGAPLRGRAAVAAEWKRYFAEPAAPFSWQPDTVLVLPSGQLAQTEGPVMNPQGRVFARFQSVWRREAPQTWRIVFDSGHPVCDAVRG